MSTARRTVVAAATHPTARRWAAAHGIDRPVIVTNLDSLRGLDPRNFHICIADGDATPHTELRVELHNLMRLYDITPTVVEPPPGRTAMPDQESRT